MPRSLITQNFVEEFDASKNGVVKAAEVPDLGVTLERASLLQAVAKDLVKGGIIDGDVSSRDTLKTNRVNELRILDEQIANRDLPHAEGIVSRRGGGGWTALDTRILHGHTVDLTESKVGIRLKLAVHKCDIVLNENLVKYHAILSLAIELAVFENNGVPSSLREVTGLLTSVFEEAAIEDGVGNG
ncbi:hypothetical protein FGB62_198g027 [Gracilaria domingensis]|nr:hypothetical protein FGB62_198g027 [Gracilaria domingensis]